MFIIIPSVLICLIFELTQGERIEEFIFGIKSGILLDLIYLIHLLSRDKKLFEKMIKQKDKAYEKNIQFINMFAVLSCTADHSFCRRNTLTTESYGYGLQNQR